MSDVRIDTVGRINTPGSDEGMYIKVEEVTGGYIILKSPHRDFNTGFDDWVQQARLQDYFDEAGWDITWEAD
jgi:hypothetical protein